MTEPKGYIGHQFNQEDGTMSNDNFDRGDFKNLSRSLFTNTASTADPYPAVRVGSANPSSVPKEEVAHEIGVGIREDTEGPWKTVTLLLLKDGSVRWENQTEQE